jgi:hypothetical protein
LFCKIAAGSEIAEASFGTGTIIIVLMALSVSGACHEASFSVAPASPVPPPLTAYQEMKIIALMRLSGNANLTHRRMSKVGGKRVLRLWISKNVNSNIDLRCALTEAYLIMRSIYDKPDCSV